MVRKNMMQKEMSKANKSGKKQEMHKIESEDRMGKKKGGKK